MYEYGDCTRLPAPNAEILATPYPHSLASQNLFREKPGVSRHNYAPGLCQSYTSIVQPLHLKNPTCLWKDSDPMSLSFPNILQESIGRIIINCLSKYFPSCLDVFISYFLPFAHDYFYIKDSGESFILDGPWASLVAF
jgi:hypothetical protein